MWFVIGVTFSGKFICLDAFEFESIARFRCDELWKLHVDSPYSIFDHMYVKFIPSSHICSEEVPV